MTADELLKWWNRTFSGVPLVPQRLRDAYADRWLRIHSLPHGKRYAESRDEEAEILRRQNTVIGDLLGAGRPYDLVFGYYEATLPNVVTVALNDFRPVPLTTLQPEESGLDVPVPLFVASAIWTRGPLCSAPLPMMCWRAHC